MSGTSPWWVADFDSAAGLLRALARALRGEDFPALGQARWMEVLAKRVNLLPPALARKVFTAGGWAEALAPARLHEVRAADLGRWVAAAYPDGPFPMAFVGSASGAAVHLATAVGAPWLPQTVLLPVRNSGGSPDDPRQGCAFGRRIAGDFLAANPDLALHQMHDPSQDRLMIRGMSYFRVKRRSLGEDYRRFLRERLEPGATIVVLDCRRRWPVTRLSERHVFQFGAIGGASADEFHGGGPRVEAFLHAQGSRLRAWDPPAADEMAPEAEWGLDPALADDVAAFADEHGYRVARLSYEEPDDLSLLVADLHRWWYASLGLDPARRLVAESFVLVEPLWVLRTGAVPLWMTFNTEQDLRRLRGYLDRHVFDEVGVMLFPNGVASIGQPGLDRWRAELARARQRGTFLGVDEERFPVDFAALARYHDALAAWPAEPAAPHRLDIEALREFLRTQAHRHDVEVAGL